MMLGLDCCEMVTVKARIYLDVVIDEYRNVANSLLFPGCSSAMDRTVTRLYAGVVVNGRYGYEF